MIFLCSSLPIELYLGLIFFGTWAGLLNAVHLDGTLAWVLQLNDGGGGIESSPVLSANGSTLYIVR